MDVQTHQLPEPSMFYGVIGDKIGVGVSTACKKVNTTDTDVNLFRPVPMPGHSAQVLPLKPLPVPRQGAQICARAPTKGYVPYIADMQKPYMCVLVMAVYWFCILIMGGLLSKHNFLVKGA